MIFQVYIQSGDYEGGKYSVKYKHEAPCAKFCAINGKPILTCGENSQRWAVLLLGKKLIEKPSIYLKEAP
jgi:hypothetical protein